MRPDVARAACLVNHRDDHSNQCEDEGPEQNRARPLRPAPLIEPMIRLCRKPRPVMRRGLRGPGRSQALHKSLFRWQRAPRQIALILMIPSSCLHAFNHNKLGNFHQGLFNRGNSASCFAATPGMAVTARFSPRRARGILKRSFENRVSHGRFDIRRARKHSLFAPGSG